MVGQIYLNKHADLCGISKERAITSLTRKETTMPTYKLTLEVEVTAPHDPASPQLTMTPLEIVAALLATKQGAGYPIVSRENPKSRTASLNIKDLKLHTSVCELCGQVTPQLLNDLGLRPEK